jgi:hypothetical protein
MAYHELERGPGLITRGFEQSTAGDGRSLDRGQVGVVGLVTGIDREAILFGDEGMEDAGLETGGREVTLNDPVIAAGAFDGHDSGTELVRLEGVPDLTDRVFQSRPGMLDDGGWYEDAAVEVGEEELGTCFGTVETDDAKVFGSDQLDAGVEHPTWLADRLERRFSRRT